MTKSSRQQTKHMLMQAGMVVSLAIGAVAAAGSAQAQVYFRPFAYAFPQPMVEDVAPYGSYRGIARILAREGFRLVGPLGSRGDQVVATGVDSYGRRMRFIIDPYEGQVLHSRPLGSARVYDAPNGFAEPPSRGFGPADPGSEPTVIPGVSQESRSAEPNRAKRRQNSAPHANLTSPPAPPIQSAARPQGSESPNRVARPESGSRRAIAPPRPAKARPAPAEDAKAAPGPVAPAPVQPAAAAGTTPGETTAPAQTTGPQQPAARAPARGAGEAQASQASTVAKPPASQPEAAAAAPKASAPAKIDATNDPDPKEQTGAGG
jgi:hypothetical protein